MVTTTALTITGYHNQLVPHTFVQQERDTQHLAIVFPGWGYTSHMPLLYYPRRLLLDAGADVLRVEYDYTQSHFLSLPKPEQNQWLFTDVLAAYDVALQQRPYTQLTLIGKSIGTLALGHILTTRPAIDTTRYIWLTPLLRNETLRTQMTNHHHRALFVIGTRDYEYDRELLADVEHATRGESVVIDQANHSLEIEDDLLASLHAMTHVMSAIQRFISR